MKNDKSYISFTWFVLVMTFVVIAAGGIVRMTQSGMGCPDWPTCFGSWIPPTSADQLPADFEKYLSKQDIDHSFNVYHTWTEYVNRLLGALLGVVIFIHFIWSFKYRKTKKEVFWLAVFLLIGVGFQGWLGKVVVDNNLAVAKITTHMVAALVLAAIPLLIISRFKEHEKVKVTGLKAITIIFLLLLVVQIALGTDVREQIDSISKPLNYGQRELWIAQLDRIFIIHRSFSWFLLAVAVYIFYKSKNHPSLRKGSSWIVGTVLFTAVIGIVMNYANIPAWSQTTHLLLASLLSVITFNFILKLK